MSGAVLGPAPDFVEPITAWRVWRVVEQAGELLLASVVKRTVWRPGEPLVAECLDHRPFVDWVRRRPVHEAPQERCECGIYAATLDYASRYLNDALPDALTRVVGRVALWGTVVECEHGYRASHAYPVELFVPADPARGWKLDLRAIVAGLRRYGVPTELLDTDRRGAPALLEATTHS